MDIDGGLGLPFFEDDDDVGIGDVLSDVVVDVSFFGS